MRVANCARGSVRLGLVLLLASGLATRSAPAHPLHTTMTDVTHQPANGAVVVVIRTFEDDFGEAVSRAARARSAAAMAAYVQSTFVLVGPDGRRIPLQWKGIRKTDDLLWIRLEGRAPRGLRGGSVRNTMIHDLYADQINVVKARYQGREQTLLFTRGAGPKRLS